MSTPPLEVGAEVTLTDGTRWVIDAISEEGGETTYTLLNPKNGETQPARAAELQTQRH